MGEADKLHGPVIQLTLTESFAKHKRNLLFVCSAVAILALADPDRITIPGLGTDQLLPNSVAYFALGAALAYFFASYWIELMAVQALNLEATAGDGLGGVGGRLRAVTKPMTEAVDVVQGYAQQFKVSVNAYLQKWNDSQFSQSLESLKRASRRLEESIDELSEARVVTDGRAFVDLTMNINGNLGGTEQQLKGLIKRLDELISLGQHSEVHSKYLEILVSDLNRSTDLLSDKLDVVSKRISRSQRIGFGALEKWIPTVFCGLAFLVCLDGAVNGSRIAEAIRGNVPAIVEARKLDAQTGTRIPGKP